MGEAMVIFAAGFKTFVQLGNRIPTDPIMFLGWVEATNQQN